MHSSTLKNIRPIFIPIGANQVADGKLLEQSFQFRDNQRACSNPTDSLPTRNGFCGLFFQCFSQKLPILRYDSAPFWGWAAFRHLLGVEPIGFNFCNLKLRCY
jgi:hypothetical protein